MSFRAFLIRYAPVIFVFLWSTGFVVPKFTAEHVEPLTFLAFRFPIAAFVMLMIALQQQAPWPVGRNAMHGVVSGVFIHAGYLAPIYWAITNGLPGGVSALIVGLQPLLTAVFACRLLGEQLSWRHWVGLATGICGVALVLLPKLSFALLGGITPATAGAVLGGTLSISFGSVYQKKFLTGVHIASGGFWQYVGGAVVVLAGAAVFERFGFDGSANAWFGLAWSVLVLSIGAIFLLMMLIRDGSVARVSSLMFLVPGVSALTTYLLFNETLTLVQGLGMAVCAVAVLIVNRK